MRWVLVCERQGMSVWNSRLALRPNLGNVDLPKNTITLFDMCYALTNLVNFSRDVSTEDVGVLLQDEVYAGKLTAYATSIVY
jgi:hypothetical protein